MHSYGRDGMIDWLIPTPFFDLEVTSHGKWNQLTGKQDWNWNGFEWNCIME